MRVLLINYEFPPIGAGAGNATANIARCLARLGLDVLVLTSRYRNLPWFERLDGYSVRRVPAVRRRSDRSSPLEMATFIIGALVPSISVCRWWKPSVTCAFFGVPSGPLALVTRRLFGVPYVVSLRGGDVPGFLGQDLRAYHRAVAPLIRAVWYGSSGLIANSQGLAELARRTWSDAPIQVIPNGVDVDRFRPPDRIRPSHPLRLLCVGRLVRQKGTAYLLRALAELRTPAVLRVVGDGPERPALESLTDSLGLRHRVEFCGWTARQELPFHYQWADIFTLPSFEEGMPNVILEALAAGLPIIATDVAGSQELVVPGQNGLLAPAGNVAGLVAAIDQLGANASKLREMGAASRLAALGRRWETVAEQYHVALVAASTPGRTVPLGRTAT